MARRTKANTKELQERLEYFYLSERNFTQKELAEKVGVTEKTISDWIKDLKLADKKRSLLVTKRSQLVNMYNQLEKLNEEIKSRPIVYDVPASLRKAVIVKDAKGNSSLQVPKINEEDFPVKIGNTPTSKEADIISKITSSINRLETETGAGETIEVGIAFINFIKPHDLEFAKKFTDHFDAFIQTKL